MSFYMDTDDQPRIGHMIWTAVGAVVLVGALTLASWGIGIWTAPWVGRANRADGLWEVLPGGMPYYLIRDRQP